MLRYPDPTRQATTRIRRNTRRPNRKNSNVKENAWNRSVYAFRIIAVQWNSGVSQIRIG